MEKTRAIKFCLLAAIVLTVAMSCDGKARSSPEPKKVCEAVDVARTVGNAIVNGNPSVVRSILVSGADIAWLQNAPNRDHRDASFNRHVYEQAAIDVDAWNRVAGRSHILEVQMPAVKRNQELEGFARRTDVIDDAAIILGGTGRTTRVVIQHMFLIDGCWRVMEIGRPE